MTNLDVIESKIEKLESLIERQSYELEGIRKMLLRSIEDNHDLYEDLAATEALENIESEIIARACRNGVCED